MSRSSKRFWLDLRGGRVLPAILLAIFVLAFSATAAWAVGALSQKSGTAGCISEDGSDGTGGVCQDGRGLREVESVAISPDGEDVYSLSFQEGTVAKLDREPTSGELSQDPGSAGCISPGGSGGCNVGKKLSGGQELVASPDGRNVYVAASTAVVTLNRGVGGSLTQETVGTSGCIAEQAVESVCAPGKKLSSPVALAVSPDGKNVYVASFDNKLAVLNRNAATGVLSQTLTGTGGCVHEQIGGECEAGKALRIPAKIAVSPDGRNVYLSSFFGVSIFSRDPTTGALHQNMTGTSGCITRDGSEGKCQKDPTLLGVEEIAFGPDGRTAYVASQATGTVGIYDRDPSSGALAKKAGPAGCITVTGNGGACQRNFAVRGAWGIALSPDGANVYVASFFFSGVAIFNRDPSDGTLAPEQGVAGCIAEEAEGFCLPGRAIADPEDIVVSPDGKSVYASSIEYNSVAILDRALPPVQAQGQGQAQPPTDTVAPIVSGFRLLPARFATVPKPKTSPRILFTLSEPAAVRIVIERAGPGRRVGKRCRKPSSALAKKPRCTRVTRVKALTFKDRSVGSNKIAFGLARSLAPGSYRATIAATDPAGNASAPRRSTFTVMRAANGG